MSKLLLLSARRYSFTDEGRTVSGIMAHYVEPYLEDDPDCRGFTPLKIATTESVFEALAKGPVLVDGEFSRKPGKGGKPSTILSAVKVLKTVDLGTL